MSRRNENASGAPSGIPKEKFTTYGAYGMASCLLHDNTEQPTRRCTMAALVPWRPMRELETMQRRMDDLFERLTERFFGPWGQERSVWETEARAPAIESHVDKDTLVVKVDLPGIDPKDVSIS